MDLLDKKVSIFQFPNWIKQRHQVWIEELPSKIHIRPLVQHKAKQSLEFKLNPQLEPEEEELVPQDVELVAASNSQH